jgi:hypothetical protein
VSPYYAIREPNVDRQLKAIVFDVIETKNDTGNISYTFKQVDLEADPSPAELASVRTFDENKGDVRVNISERRDSVGNLCECY